MSETSLYRCYDALGRLLYVGVTGGASARWTKHRTESLWWHLVERMDLEHYPSRADALEAEAEQIVALRPIHNVQHGGSRVCTTDGCRKHLMWVDLDSPAAVFEEDGRVYRGAWLCPGCHDYINEPAPVSAALDGELGRIALDEARAVEAELADGRRAALARIAERVA